MMHTIINMTIHSKSVYCSVYGTNARYTIPFTITVTRGLHTTKNVNRSVILCVFQWAVNLQQQTQCTPTNRADRQRGLYRGDKTILKQEKLLIKKSVTYFSPGSLQFYSHKVTSKVKDRRNPKLPRGLER